jgi:hypothetical protein
MDVNVKISLTADGKIKFTSGSDRVRIDSLDKFLGRNDDATLVKLKGPHDDSMKYKPGHVCRIEKDDENDNEYNVFVGKHFIGQLPDKAIEFAKMVDSEPDWMVAVVGKVEDDEIYIYIAE